MALPGAVWYAERGASLDDVLPVEWLQESLDQYVARHGGSMDYIHDPGAVEELSLQTRAIGFLLPPFPVRRSFPYVKRRGALPRKIFPSAAAGINAILKRGRCFERRGGTNMKEITLDAYGKLNLTLDILGRRPDGYHDLRMVMQMFPCATA